MKKFERKGKINFVDEYNVYFGGIMEFLIENKELLMPIALSLLYLAEKFIKQSKLKQNDILIDFIIKPMINALKAKK